MTDSLRNFEKDVVSVCAHYYYDLGKLATADDVYNDLCANYIEYAPFDTPTGSQVLHTAIVEIMNKHCY